jgi:hypothetical protein
VFERGKTTRIRGMTACLLRAGLTARITGQGCSEMKKLWSLYWAPEGRKIAVNISAESPGAALRKTPKHYKKYLGEVYAVRQQGEIIY